MYWWYWYLIDIKLVINKQLCLFFLSSRFRLDRLFNKMTGKRLDAKTKYIYMSVKSLRKLTIRESDTRSTKHVLKFIQIWDKYTRIINLTFKYKKYENTPVYRFEIKYTNHKFELTIARSSCESQITVHQPCLGCHYWIQATSSTCNISLENTNQLPLQSSTRWLNEQYW